MRKKKLLTYVPFKKHASLKPKGNLLKPRLLQLNECSKEVHHSFAQAIIGKLGSSATNQHFLILTDQDISRIEIEEKLMELGVPCSHIDANSYHVTKSSYQIRLKLDNEQHTELPHNIVLAFSPIYSLMQTRQLMKAYPKHFQNAKNLFVYSPYKSYRKSYGINAEVHPAYIYAN